MADNRMKLELYIDVQYLGSYRGDQVGYSKVKEVGEYKRMIDRHTTNMSGAQFQDEVELLMYVDNSNGEVLETWMEEEVYE